MLDGPPSSEVRVTARNGTARGRGSRRRSSLDERRLQTEHQTVEPADELRLRHSKLGFDRAVLVHRRCERGELRTESAGERALDHLHGAAVNADEAATPRV